MANITFNPNKATTIDRAGNKRSHFRPFRASAGDWARKIHDTAPSVVILMTEGANGRIMIFAGNETMTDQCRRTLLDEVRDYTNRLLSASYFVDPSYAEGFARTSQSSCMIQPPAKANLSQQKIEDIVAGVDNWARTATTGTGTRTAPAGAGADTGNGAAPTGNGTGNGAAPTGNGTGNGAAPAGNGGGTAPAPAGNGGGTAPAPADNGGGNGAAPTGNSNGGIPQPVRPAGANDGKWNAMKEVYALYYGQGAANG